MFFTVVCLKDLLIGYQLSNRASSAVGVCYYYFLFSKNEPKVTKNRKTMEPFLVRVEDANNCDEQENVAKLPI